eukprot:TRINITY_DN1968_c2_g1_i2.p1 TRINITY_DN1968_c2_g1~~TRINITY_DN1968_c2_g1_i2.p1  ORF type:complete len:1372 (+),score=184.62 TRINITY_DN1968_c2_g1_i2:257-4372(+)
MFPFSLFESRSTSKFKQVCELHIIEGSEAIVSIEVTSEIETANRGVVIYQFAAPKFQGVLSAQLLPSTGGSVLKAAVCQLTNRIVTASKHIISVFNLSTDQAVTPVLEVHTPLQLSSISLCDNILSYGCSDEIWCLSIGVSTVQKKQRNQQQQQQQQQQPDDQTPLRSGWAQSLLDPSYVKVKFATPVDVTLPPTGKRTRRVNDAATTTSHSHTESKTETTNQGGFLLNSHSLNIRSARQSSIFGLSTQYHYSDGSVRSLGKWDLVESGLVAYIHPSHPVFIFDGSDGASHSFDTSGRDAKPRLLYKRRLTNKNTSDSSTVNLQQDGELLHSAILRGNRLLVVAQYRGWICDLCTGRELCSYSFSGECRLAANSSMYLFALIEQKPDRNSSPPGDVVEVFPLRVSDERLSHSRQNRDLVVSPLQTARVPPFHANGMKCSEDGLFIIFESGSFDTTDHLDSHSGIPGTNFGLSGVESQQSWSPSIPSFRETSRMRATSGGSSSAASSVIHNFIHRSQSNISNGHPSWLKYNATHLKIATPPEALQEVLKEHRRCQVWDENMATQLLDDAHQFIHSHVQYLKGFTGGLMGGDEPCVDQQVFSNQLHLYNTLTLEESVATMLADLYLRAEVSSANISTQKHLHTSPRNAGSRNSTPTATSELLFNAVAGSHISGGSIDGASEHSVFSSSYGDVGGGVHGQWDEPVDTREGPQGEGGLEKNSRERLNLRRNTHATSAASLSHQIVPSSSSSWLYYSVSDRSLKQVCLMLRKHPWALLSYLDIILFSKSRPKGLSASVDYSGQPLVSEELGNTLLTLYARYAPHRLCAVVWDSWLGRAKGGTACFTAGKAARLLREASRRHQGTSPSQTRRHSLGYGTSRATSIHTRSLDGSEGDEGDQSPGGTVTGWPCTSPRENFVMGLLLLEDGNVSGCVEVWSAVDGMLLTELASSSRHLWEPDVKPNDQDEDPLSFINSFNLKSPEISDAQDVQDANRPQTTMGTLLANFFPWLLVPALIEARNHFLIPITSALRLIKLMSHRQGLAVTHFLSSIIPPPSPIASSPRSKKRISTSSTIAGVLSVHLLKELDAYAGRCEKYMASQAHQLEVTNDIDDEEFDDSLVFCQTGHDDFASPKVDVVDEDEELPNAPLEVDTTLTRPAEVTLTQFREEVEALDAYRQTACVGIRKLQVPSWIREISWGCDLQGDVFHTSLTSAGHEHFAAAMQHSLHLYQSLLWNYQIPEGITESLHAALQKSTDKLLTEGLVSLLAIVYVKTGDINQALETLEPQVSAPQLLSFALEHCGSSPELWRDLICRLASLDRRDSLSLILSKICTMFPLNIFASVLPKDGNTRYFLPFIARAVDSEKALKAQALTAASVI